MGKYIFAQVVAAAFATATLSAEPAAVPDLNEARIVLPYAELKALWQAAQKERPEKRKPPVESALLAARYQLLLKGYQAAGGGKSQTESFTDERTVIPVLGAKSQLDKLAPPDVQLIVR